MNFKSWLETTDRAEPFSGSTIKSVVFHGTDKNPFASFSYQTGIRRVLFSEFPVQSKGFFFSESPHDALEYGRNVVACYIDLKKPLLDPRADKHLGVDRLLPKKEEDLAKILLPMIAEDEKGKFIDLGVGRHYLRTGLGSDFELQWIYYAVSSMGLNWDVLDNPASVAELQKLGYDGTFVAEPDTWLGRSIFVLDPAQIRMIGWHKKPESSWGNKEDYLIQKKDGLQHFSGPKF